MNKHWASAPPSPLWSLVDHRGLRTLGALMIAVALVYMSTSGASALWSGSTSVSQTAGTGSTAISLGTSGTSANRLSVGVSNMVPGSSAQRAVDVRNDGTIWWGSLSLTSSATSSSALDTNTTDGLKLTVHECTQAWVESGSNPNFSYSCPGTSNLLLSSVPPVGTAAVNGAALQPGTTGHYRLTISLPASAPSSLQGLSSTFSISFAGMQRNGTAR